MDNIIQLREYLPETSLLDWFEYIEHGSLTYFLGRKEDGRVNYDLPEGIQWEKLDDVDGMASLIFERVQKKFSKPGVSEPKQDIRARAVKATGLSSLATSGGLKTQLGRKEAVEDYRIAQLAHQMDLDRRHLYFFFKSRILEQVKPEIKAREAAGHQGLAAARPGERGFVINPAVAAFDLSVMGLKGFNRVGTLADSIISPPKIEQEKAQESLAFRSAKQFGKGGLEFFLADQIKTVYEKGYNGWKKELTFDHLGELAKQHTGMSLGGALGTSLAEAALGTVIPRPVLDHFLLPFIGMVSGSGFNEVIDTHSINLRHQSRSALEFLGLGALSFLPRRALTSVAMNVGASLVAQLGGGLAIRALAWSGGLVPGLLFTAAEMILAPKLDQWLFGSPDLAIDKSGIYR